MITTERKPMGAIQRLLDDLYFAANHESVTRRLLEPVLMFLDDRR